MVDCYERRKKPIQRNYNFTALTELQESGELLNYKELCERLEIKCVDGNSKKKTLSDLEKVCSFEMVGKKYHITEVHTSGIVLNHGNNGYDSYILKVLGNLLPESGELYISKIALAEELGMVNHHFRNDRYKIDISDADWKNFGCTYDVLQDGFNVIKKILTQWIDNSINRLVDKKYITKREGYQYSIKIPMNNGEDDYFVQTNNVLGEDENIFFQIDTDTKKKLGIKSDSMSGETRTKYHICFFNNLNNTYAKKGIVFDNVWKCYILQKDQFPDMQYTDYIQAISVINAEAKRKIEETKQLNFLSPNARNYLIKNFIV